MLSVGTWQRREGIPDKVFLFVKSLLGIARLGSIAPRYWPMPCTVPPGATFQSLPVELAADCIAASTSPGDWVLDPFAGSGAVGVAAHRAGRNAMLIDTCPMQIGAASDRLKAAGALA
jgi:site-specific DNA-methyltransferase (adenine-specific)